jgi:hypothetical protein
VTRQSNAELSLRAKRKGNGADEDGAIRRSRQGRKRSRKRQSEPVQGRTGGSVSADANALIKVGFRSSRNFGSTISRTRHSRAGEPGRKPRHLVQRDKPALRRWEVVTQSLL